MANLFFFTFILFYFLKIKTSPAAPQATARGATTKAPRRTTASTPSPYVLSSGRIRRSPAVPASPPDYGYPPRTHRLSAPLFDKIMHRRPSPAHARAPPYKAPFAKARFRDLAIRILTPWIWVRLYTLMWYPSKQVGTIIRSASRVCFGNAELFDGAGLEYWFQNSQIECMWLGATDVVRGATKWC